MDQPQPSKDNLSYKHDRQGFMLYYKGQAIGGLGSIRKDYIINDQDQRAKEYEMIAKEHIRRILSANLGSYEKTIRRVDSGFRTPEGDCKGWTKSN